jgi:hypothetical protein
MTNSHEKETRLKTILGSRNGIGIVAEILTKQEDNEERRQGFVSS